jgi:hypothetical protein
LHSSQHGPEPSRGSSSRQPSVPRFLRALLHGLAAALLVLGALLALVIQSKPSVQSPPEAPQHYLAKARNILHNTVPTQGVNGLQKTVALTAEDLAAAANFALSRKKLEGHAAVTVDRSRLKLLASVRLPIRAVPAFLNVRVIADDAQPQAVIKQLKVGRLALPRPLVQWLLRGAFRYTPLFRYGRIGSEVIQEIRIADDRLRVTFSWNQEAIAKAKDLVTDLASKERLLIYHHRLAEVLSESDSKRFIRLGILMQPLFVLAQNRSQEDNDPIEENRAVILVLSAYVNGRNITQLISSRDPPVIPIRRIVLLNGRLDTAQHFMTSATLAMSGHRTFADLVGLAKEINDTHSGSGFSFTDLAADRAGAMFGKLAAKSEDKARKVQSILGQSADEAVFMPAIKDLPENLSPADFTSRFKAIDSPEFEELKGQIEERIAALPLYQ